MSVHTRYVPLDRHTMDSENLTRSSSLYPPHVNTTPNIKTETAKDRHSRHSSHRSSSRRSRNSRRIRRILHEHSKRIKALHDDLDKLTEMMHARMEANAIDHGSSVTEKCSPESACVPTSARQRTTNHENDEKFFYSSVPSLLFPPLDHPIQKNSNIL